MTPEPEPTPEQIAAAEKIRQAGLELVRQLDAYTRACDQMREAVEAGLASGIPVKDVKHLARPDSLVDPGRARRGRVAIDNIIKSAAEDAKQQSSGLAEWTRNQRPGARRTSLSGQDRIRREQARDRRQS